MSVLVLAESSNGKFKKSSFEVTSYGKKVAVMKFSRDKTQQAKYLFEEIKKKDSIISRVEKVRMIGGNIVVSIRPPKSDYYYRDLIFISSKHEQSSLQRWDYRSSNDNPYYPFNNTYSFPTFYYVIDEN